MIGLDTHVTGFIDSGGDRIFLRVLEGFHHGFTSIQRCPAGKAPGVEGLVLTAHLEVALIISWWERA